MSNEEGSPEGVVEGSAVASEGSQTQGSSLGSAATNVEHQQPVNWRDSISDASIKESPYLNNIKADNYEQAIDQLARQGYHANKLIGGDKVPKPQENWTSEQRLQFNQEALGVPGDLSAYSYEQDGEGFKFSEDFLNSYSEKAQLYGLKPEEAQGLISEIKGQFDAYSTAEVTTLQEKLAQDIAPLQQKWGDKWDMNIDQTEGFLEKVGGEPFMQFLADNPNVANNPVFIEAMHGLSTKAMSDVIHTGAEMDMNVGGPAMAQSEVTKIQSDPVYNDLVSKAQKGIVLSGEERMKLDSYKERMVTLYQTMYPAE